MGYREFEAIKVMANRIKKNSKGDSQTIRAIDALLENARKAKIDYEDAMEKLRQYEMIHGHEISTNYDNYIRDEYSQPKRW